MAGAGAVHRNRNHVRCLVPGCGWEDRAARRFADADQVLVEHLVRDHPHRALADMVSSLWMQQPTADRAIRPVNRDQPTPHEDLLAGLLRHLQDAGEPVPFAELRERIGERPRIVAYMLKRLESEGLVRRCTPAIWEAVP